jgi:multidrug efflux pump subunit AcrA (membrane-fusion protein)
MDFSSQLDALQKRVTEAQAEITAAATETRDQLKQRIDQAQVDVNLGLKDAKQQAGTAADDAQNKWAQMKADAAAKLDDVKAKIDKRTDQIDARAAASDADWAENDAIAAIDYADWTFENARLAVLDAIDARAYADERAKAATA